MNITPFAVLICLVYFVLGYTIYAFIAAVTGATVSKAEDVQAASGPISMIALISFYLAYFTATVPNSSASKFASIFPFSAAFSMPGRIFAGSATGTEIGISIAVLLVTTVLLAYISIKVYKIAILHYGNRLKLSSLFKMYKTEK
jgi:ABC-2 type transport system permease protein